jgi:hypothetical protein
MKPQFQKQIKHRKHMSKRTEFTPLGTFLTNIIPQEHSWKIKLFGHWKKIIGNLSEKVRIEKITCHSITLGVCHATWAQELFLLSRMIKKKINVLLKEEKIKNIQFKTVSFDKNKNKKRIKSICKSKKEHNLSIVEHSHLQTVKNQELARELGRFYVRCKETK